MSVSSLQGFNRPALSLAGAAIVAIALAAGLGLRVVHLDSVPPGLHHDEACDGYDAYSLLKTGRDQHGNFLPLAIQAFNDYRPPIFDYSLVPLIAAFGLKPAVVRLGAALWGGIDLIGIALLAGIMFGWPGAAAAALFGAFSPWHLPLSRFGQESITGSATVTLALLCFFQWLKSRRESWLPAAAAFLGLSLYSYSVAKLFVPMMAGWLGLLYWRELRTSRRAAMLALAIVAAMAVPLAAITLAHPIEMQARFNQMSLFRFMATCPGCRRAAAQAANDSLFARLANFAANAAGYFSPAYLFLTGDRGDHWALLHPPGFGQLMPEQAPLIAIALAGLLSSRRRKLMLLLAGWVILAAIPAAFTVPSGAWQPQAGLPDPFVFLGPAVRNVPLTPGLLFAHPESRRNVLAITPWILLSAAGFAVVIEMAAPWARVEAALAAAILLATVFHGARFVRSYFHDYPVIAAPYFQYGLGQALGEVRKLAAGGGPVVVTDRVMTPYIYVLFFEHYPPASFQSGPVVYGPGSFGSSLDAPVLRFDRYLFVNPGIAYARLDRGTFVFAGDQPAPEPPAATIRYLDGRIAYQIVTK